MEQKRIGVYTSICEEDVVWIPQYLKEIERLGLDFVMHFDRCTDETKKRIKAHPRCVGSTEQDDHAREFSETDKQKAHDKLIELGYDWSMAWDMDETWEKDMPAKLDMVRACTDYDYIIVHFFHLWGDSKHIRVDEEFGRGSRTKFQNLKSFDWKWRSHVVNGPSAVGNKGYQWCRMGWMNIHCIHWGLMTPELRQFHKDRWDRIYGHHSDNGNPYGFWALALTPGVVVEYDKVAE